MLGDVAAPPSAGGGQVSQRDQQRRQRQTEADEPRGGDIGAQDGIHGLEEIQMGAGFLGLVFHLHIQAVPGSRGIGGHDPPGGHLPPGAVAPQIAQEGGNRARRPRCRQPQTASQRAAGGRAGKQAFHPAPDYPGRHNKGQHHKADHMGAHHGKAGGKAQNQLAHIALPVSLRG